MKLVLLLYIAATALARGPSSTYGTAGQSILLTRDENTPEDLHVARSLPQDNISSPIVRRTIGKKGKPSVDTETLKHKAVGWEKFSDSGADSGSSGKEAKKSSESGGRGTSGSDWQRSTSESSGSPGNSQGSLKASGVTRAQTQAQKSQGKSQKAPIPGPERQTSRAPSQPAGMFPWQVGSQRAEAPVSTGQLRSPRPGPKRSMFLAKTSYRAQEPAASNLAMGQADHNPPILASESRATGADKPHLKPVLRNDQSLFGLATSQQSSSSNGNPGPSRKRGRETAGSVAQGESRLANQKRPKVAKGIEPTADAAQDANQRSIHGVEMLLAAHELTSTPAHQDQAPASPRPEGRNTAVPRRQRNPPELSSPEVKKPIAERLNLPSQPRTARPGSRSRPGPSANLAPADQQFARQHSVTFQPQGQTNATPSRNRPSSSPGAVDHRAVGNQPNSPVSFQGNDQLSAMQQIRLLEQLQFLHQQRIDLPHMLPPPTAPSTSPLQALAATQSVSRHTGLRQQQQQPEATTTATARNRPNSTPTRDRPSSGPTQPSRYQQERETWHNPRGQSRSQAPASSPPQSYNPRRVETGQPRHGTGLLEWSDN